MLKQRNVKLLSLLILMMALIVSSCGNDDPEQDDTIGLSGSSQVGVDGIPRPSNDLPTEETDPTRTPEEDEPQDENPDNNHSSSTTPGSEQSPRGGTSPTTPITNPEPEPQAVSSGPSAEDRDRLMNGMSINPSVAYLGENTRFSMGASSDVLNQWEWKYKFSNGGWRSASNGRISTTFDRLGRQKLQLQASWDNIEIPFEHNLLVTVSQQWLNDKLKALISAVKSADANGNWSEADRLVDELKPYFASDASFSIPEEGGGNNWQTFIDILYADIPFEDRFSKVSDYKYDNATGLVSYLKVR